MDEAVHGGEACLADISTEMERNLLNHNQTKTELTVFSSKQSFRLKVGSIYMEFAKSVRKLGIISKWRNKLMLFINCVTTRYVL